MVEQRAPGEGAVIGDWEPGGKVWAGMYDPRQSAIVRDISKSLAHPCLLPEDPHVGRHTPGEQLPRERDRADFSKALALLNDGLEDLCHNMRKSVEASVDAASWPPEMDAPFPASARSSNLSKAPSQQRVASSARQHSNGSARAEADAATSDQRVRRTPSGHSVRAGQERQEQKTRSTPGSNAQADSHANPFQHDLWVNERVDTLMREIREAQSKLRPKMTDRSVLAELGQRLDGLERRSAVAGQRSTAISDPLGPAGTPQFLPTITESSDPKARGGAGQMPHQIPYTQQHHMQQHYLQYHAQPPAHQRRYQPNDEQNRSNGSLHPAPHHFLGQQQHHGGQNVPNGGQNWFLPPIPVHAGGGWGRGFGNAVGASEQDWAARGGGWGGGGGVGGDWRGGGGGGWGYEDSQDGVARVRHHMSNVHGNGHLPHRAPNAFASSPRAAGRDGGGNGDSSGARGGGGVNPRHKRLSGAAPRGAGGAGVDVQRQSVNSSVGSSAAPSPRKNRYRKSAASDSPSPVVCQPVPPKARKRYGANKS